MAGTKGTKEIRSSYPFTDGLTAKTTSQEGHADRLIPELGTLVSRRYRI
jgi:hypothetical protein